MMVNPKVGVGYSEVEESFAAGQLAAREAISRGALESCDLALLFSTGLHNPQALRDGVRSIIGPRARLAGGWAVGTISNDSLGYGGFQCSIACFSIQSTDFDLFRADGLADNEAEVGERLGELLAAARLETTDIPKILLYDSINRLSGRIKLNMATPLLGGMRKAVPDLNNLVGAGLMGDMGGRQTYQWFDDEICQQSVMALTFSSRIAMHTVVLRGAYPVGGYRTVTRSEGATVMEIDGRPALEVISEMFNGMKDPSEFAFSVMLGVNHGDLWAPYDEMNYSNCLCLRIDLKRNELIMFEPELTPGTRFQLMSRNHDFSYIQRRVDELFQGIGQEMPFFALYINCAGRAGAYAGIDDEDARHVQHAINSRAPLLGFYSGVEIGPVRGHPKPMDWTGLLCLFTMKI